MHPNEKTAGREGAPCRFKVIVSNSELPEQTGVKTRVSHVAVESWAPPRVLGKHYGFRVCKKGNSLKTTLDIQLRIDYMHIHYSGFSAMQD